MLQYSAAAANDPSLVSRSIDYNSFSPSLRRHHSLLLQRISLSARRALLGRNRVRRLGLEQVTKHVLYQFLGRQFLNKRLGKELKIWRCARVIQRSARTKRHHVHRLDHRRNLPQPACNSKSASRVAAQLSKGNPRNHVDLALHQVNRPHGFNVEFAQRNRPLLICCYAILDRHIQFRSHAAINVWQRRNLRFPDSDGQGPYKV